MKIRTHGENGEFAPINKQFVKYVVPAVIGMVVQSIYVVLDGVIVGRGIGEIGLGAINIVFPYSMITIALAMLIAVGGANVYAFNKGRGETERANNIFCQWLALAAVIGLALALAGFALREKLVLALGANEELFPSAVAYLKWMAPFSLIQTVTFGLSVFIRNDDSPRLVMAASVTGAIVNAILDAVFILVLHYGIEVSAMTNGIGMLIELAFYATHFARKKGMLAIRKPRFYAEDVKRMLGNGFATFLMEFSVPAVTFSFNLAIVHTMGTTGVAAYSIVGYVCAVINMFLVGVTHGAQPIMSLCRGKGDRSAFLHAYRLGVRTNLIASVLLVGICVAFGDGIVSVFHAGNPELTALTRDMLRLYPAAHIAIGVTLMNILYFQATEQNALSAAVSFLRCIGFIQVFLLLSVYLLDGRGLYLAFLAGEVCNWILSQALRNRSDKRPQMAPETGA